MNQEVFVETHMAISDEPGRPLSAATIEKILQAARRGVRVRQGAADCEKSGRLLLTVTDKEYDQTVREPSLSEARAESLADRKRQLEAALRETSEVTTVVYAALDFADVFAQLKSNWKKYPEHSTKFALGYDREQFDKNAGKTRYDTAKLLFKILQLQLPGVHFRIDNDVEDEQGRGLATMIRAVEQRQPAGAERGWIASLNYLTRDERTLLRANPQPDDAFKICRGFSIRPFLAVETAVVVPQLAGSASPSAPQTVLPGVKLLPDDTSSLRFVANAMRMVDMINALTQQDEETRVVSGATMYVDNSAHESAELLTLFENLATWADDAVMSELRPGCSTTQVTGASVAKIREVDFSGTTLRSSAVDYLPTLLRGIVLMSIAKSGELQGGARKASLKQSMWACARHTLDRFARDAARMDGTVLQTLVQGRRDAFQALHAAGLVAEEFSCGLADTLEAWPRQFPNDESPNDQTPFRASIQRLIDDLAIYAGDDYTGYHETLHEMLNREQFALVGNILTPAS